MQLAFKSTGENMNQILSHCGFRCDLCLAFKPNIEKNPQNKQKLSDGWYKYFGFRIPPKDIYCEGCMSETSNLLDKECPVRPCVIEKKIIHCGNCDQYICDKLQERIVIYEEIRQKLKKEISEEDYRCFILPYENKKRLDAFRSFK
jgi:hypothetical protein